MRPVIVHATRPAIENVERITVLPSSWGPIGEVPRGSGLEYHQRLGAQAWVREIGAADGALLFVVETVDQLDEALGAVAVGQPHAAPMPDAALLRASAHRPVSR